MTDQYAVGTLSSKIISNPNQPGKASCGSQVGFVMLANTIIAFSRTMLTIVTLRKRVKSSYPGMGVIKDNRQETSSKHHHYQRLFRAAQPQLFDLIKWDSHNSQIKNNIPYGTEPPKSIEIQAMTSSFTRPLRPNIRDRNAFERKAEKKHNAIDQDDRHEHVNYFPQTIFRVYMPAQ